MGTKAYFFKRKKLIFIFLLFFTNFWKKISHFLKKLRNYSAAYRAKFYYMIGFFGNFPHTLGTLGVVENCKTIQKLHPVVCVSGRIIFSLKLGFWQIGVFTKYGCFNPSKWPQMPQKWVNTIPFGSGHTLGTLNHFTYQQCPAFVSLDSHFLCSVFEKWLCMIMNKLWQGSLGKLHKK